MKDERCKICIKLFLNEPGSTEIGGFFFGGWPVEPSALQVLFGVYIKKRGGLHL